jgi:hypothetical protein
MLEQPDEMLSVNWALVFRDPFLVMVSHVREGLKLSVTAAQGGLEGSASEAGSSHMFLSRETGICSRYEIRIWAKRAAIRDGIPGKFGTGIRGQTSYAPSLNSAFWERCFRQYASGNMVRC